MGTIRRFQDLLVWQRARELSKFVHHLTLKSPWRAGAKLRLQVLDSTESCPANIAEGFERSGNAEFLNSLAIAKGSAGETASHLYAAFDRGYISLEDQEAGVALAEEVCRLAGGLMTYLERTSLRGPKFRRRETASNPFSVRSPRLPTELQNPQLPTLPEPGTPNPEPNSQTRNPDQVPG